MQKRASTKVSQNFKRHSHKTYPLEGYNSLRTIVIRTLLQIPMLTLNRTTILSQ